MPATAKIETKKPENKKPDLKLEIPAMRIGKMQLTIIGDSLLCPFHRTAKAEAQNAES